MNTGNIKTTGSVNFLNLLVACLHGGFAVVLGWLHGLKLYFARYGVEKRVPIYIKEIGAKCHVNMVISNCGG